jgi:hypothetical protein
LRDKEVVSVFVRFSRAPLSRSLNMNVSASMQWEVILLKFRHSSDEKKLIPEALKKTLSFLTSWMRSQALVAALKVHLTRVN